MSNFAHRFPDSLPPQAPRPENEADYLLPRQDHHETKSATHIVKMTPSLFNELRRVSELTGMSASEVTRRAIRDYIPRLTNPARKDAHS